MKKVQDEFKVSALRAVHLIQKYNPAPLNLLNMFGDEGEKYVSGGMVIRRA
jgi:hypothetical protein